MLEYPPKELVALFIECVDWNIWQDTKSIDNKTSHSSLSAWIETRQMGIWQLFVFGRTLHWVRGLKRTNAAEIDASSEVALFIECVDWNDFYMKLTPYEEVSHSSLSAWIETFILVSYSMRSLSHSSLSAWIETALPLADIGMLAVALFIECVDWNALKAQAEKARSRTLHWVRGLKQLCTKQHPNR